MLCEVPLTKEQQDFAAEHHGLVYKFLNDNHLPEDEFYDVVIFGYLKAVQDYFSRETSLDKGTQRKTTENELPSLTQCTA